MKNKITLITGASGNLGGAVARRFSVHGWRVIAPIRPDSLGKDRVQKLMLLPGVHVAHCDVQEEDSVNQFIMSLAHPHTHNIPRVIFQAAGRFLWDDGFPDEKLMAAPEKVKDELTRSNCWTKENINKAILEHMAEYAPFMRNHMIGSHIALSTHDDPRRNGPFTEEYYVQAMQRVESEGKKIEKLFGSVIVHHTPLIDVAETRSAFTKERAPDITDEVWNGAITPEEYAIELFPDSFFEEQDAVAA